MPCLLAQSSVSDLAMTSHVACEVRVPTYKRPGMLHSALRSVQAQRFEDWSAIVFDDSPDEEARMVVEKLGDSRIRYIKNNSNLGCSGNIDQAFRTKAYGRADFACILEDDNRFYPDLLGDNIEQIKKSGRAVLLRNQEIRAFEDRGPTRCNFTTRGKLFSEGDVDILTLRAAMFLCEGVSNGGLFWRCDSKSDLQVGSRVADAGLQEYCRTLQITEPLYFAAAPLAIWTELPSSLSMRMPTTNRKFGRGVQAIRRCILRRHGAALYEIAMELAGRIGRVDACERAFVDSLYLPAVLRVHTRRHCHAVAKAALRLALVRNPLDHYLNSQSGVC
jgi:hypothetical protein